MALVVCEDCGHKVSDLAFACPKCARPMIPVEGAAVAPGERDRERMRASFDGGDRVGSITADTATQPVVRAEWLGDLRKARETPPGKKACKRCNADVALDSFRQKVGDGYLCADCLDADEDRRRVRGERFSKVALTLSVLLLAGAITAGAVAVIPMLQVSRGVKTAK